MNKRKKIIESGEHEESRALNRGRRNGSIDMVVMKLKTVFFLIIKEHDVYSNAINK